MMDLIAHVLAAAVATSASAETAPPRGTLCFDVRGQRIELSGNCVAVEGVTIRVEPSSEKRRFVWIDERRTEIVFGVVEPGGDAVSLRSSDLVEVSASFAGSDLSMWPAPVTVVVTEASEVHTTTLPASAMQSLRRLRLPQGRYLFEFSAPHHHPVSRSLVTAPDAALGTIVFRRYPRLSGRVRQSGTGTPIAGAEVVLLPSNEVFAVSDAAGVFGDYVSGEWPKSIRIHAPGFGSHIEQLPKVERDTSLADIRLSRGGTIRVRLDGVSEANVTLLSPMSEAVAARRFAADEEHVFVDVEPGEYVLLAEGDEPLQKFGRRVVVRGGEVTDVAIAVTPVTLEVAVRSSADPISQARLQFRHEELRWQGTAVADEDGTVMAELWQQGRFAVLIHAPAATVPFFVEITLAGTDKIKWTAELPTRSIAGVVLDERRSPVAKATVSLETESDAGGSAQARTATDVSGRFEFSFVEPGMQVVRVTAPDYLMDVQRFQLPESAQSHPLNIILQRAVRARVIVTDARRLPIAGCAVIHSLHVQPLITDDSGIVSIPMKPGERKVVYLLPRSGSFAAVSVTAPARGQDDPVHVVVPPGEVTIVVRTRTSTGDPLANVAIAMRVHGYGIPPAVMEQMAATQGLEIITSAAGVAAMRNLPAGVYELWPYFSYKEGLDIFHGLGPEPPVRLLARPGENTATLTFAAKTR